MYPVLTHWIVEIPTPNERPSVLMATATIVVSSCTTTAPTRMIPARRISAGSSRSFSFSFSFASFGRPDAVDVGVSAITSLREQPMLERPGTT